MKLLIYIFMPIVVVFPLVIFFDFNKKHNFFYGFIYLVIFGFVCAIFLPWVTATFARGLVFALAIPFLLATSLFIAKKIKKASTQKKKVFNDKRVIDDV
ncbi:MAG TPA: hypothetical protein VD905_11870 [Flavobacteriales bacterium]|nr:hypothetical protein [Flavobacteriales bacterium]